MSGPTRCDWVPLDQPDYLAYHDEEWGVPFHDDVHLFEMLVLEGAQSGLSWSTILRKRDGYRRAFEGFDPEKVARFTPSKVERLLQDPGIVRNRLKVESTIANARAVLDVQQELGSLSDYLWTFVDGKTPVPSGHVVHVVTVAGPQPGGPVRTMSNTDPGSSSFRYSASTKTWSFNLQTKDEWGRPFPAGFYDVTITPTTPGFSPSPTFRIRVQ